MVWIIHGCARGHTMTPEYRLWLWMKQRCNRPKTSCYPRYGGRGIKVCERWLGRQGFSNFLADMGHRPSKEYSLDRIDNDGNYEPGNVRWATRIEQRHNRSDYTPNVCRNGHEKSPGPCRICKNARNSAWQKRYWLKRRLSQGS